MRNSPKKQAESIAIKSAGESLRRLHLKVCREIDTNAYNINKLVVEQKAAKKLRHIYREALFNLDKLLEANDTPTKS